MVIWCVYMYTLDIIDYSNRITSAFIYDEYTCIHCEIIDYSSKIYGVFIYAEYTCINLILCYTNLHETYK